MLRCHFVDRFIGRNDLGVGFAEVDDRLWFGGADVAGDVEIVVVLDDRSPSFRHGGSSVLPLLGG